MVVIYSFQVQHGVIAAFRELPSKSRRNEPRAMPIQLSPQKTAGAVVPRAHRPDPAAAAGGGQRRRLGRGRQDKSLRTTW